MNPPRRRAFTLVEMLIVIGILGILIGMLFPTFRRAWSRSQQAQCATNLRHIAVAYNCHLADDVKSASGPLRAANWSVTLGQYLLAPRVMVCPSAGRFSGGDADRGLPGVSVEVWGRYDMALEEGPLTRRENLADGIYILRFEDYRPDGGDLDFNDVVLRIEELPSGYARITVVSIDAGFRFTLRGPEREVLIYDLHQNVGQSVTVDHLETSYGINSVVAELDAGDSRVLLLDYPKSVADCVGPDAADSWDDWTDGSGHISFARHLDRCNILFADGSVRALAPREFHPDDPDLAEAYWMPPSR